MEPVTTSADPIASPEILVAGRRFKASTATTFRQDLYVMQLVREAGLEDIAGELTRASYELSAVAEHVILSAFASGKLFDLLGAVLEEEGVPWTILGAKENAETFANLRSPADKAALNGSIVAVILGFFVNALLSSATSPKSSSSVPRPRQNDTANSDAPRNYLAVPETSAIGTASFASSGVTSPTDTSES